MMTKPAEIKKVDKFIGSPYFTAYSNSEVVLLGFFNIKKTSPMLASMAMIVMMLKVPVVKVVPS